MAVRSTHLLQLVDDDALMTRAAAELTVEDPDAPPAVNKARLRFGAGEVRAALRAVATAMDTTTPAEPTPDDQDRSSR